jgi:hypothetical protein
MEKQQLLNWLNSEQQKDTNEIEAYKRKILNELKDLKKENLIPAPKKLNLWQRIKILLGI